MFGSYLFPLVGGAFIGLATALLLLLNGRIAGISGIVEGVVRPPARDGEDGRWRALFLAGLIAGGLASRFVHADSIGVIATPLPLLAIAGVLVGFGTRLGGGCTSGHGVCGVSRGSLHSIAATVTFMAVGVVVVFLVRHAVAP